MALFAGLIPERPLMIWLFRTLSLISVAVLAYFIIHGVGNEIYYKYGGASIAALSVGFVVFEMMGTAPMKFGLSLLRFRPLAWTGRISYGLYLWHIPVFFVLGKPAHWTGAQIQIARFVLVYAVAAISYYLLERPFLKLKSRFSATNLSEPANKLARASRDQALVPAQ
jgi:peptidoglycan/LPS O-acetylase OafA/YrhL